MAGDDSGNAMTEIALALAMAFFAIMVLTMVSMGGKGSVGSADQTSAVPRPDANFPPDGVRLLPASKQAAASQGGKGVRVLKPRQLIVFTDGRFLDATLQPLDTAEIVAMTDPVLAVSPELSLAEVMAVKSRLTMPIGSDPNHIVLLAAFASPRSKPATTPSLA
jgi:hypothetical protein